MNKTHENNKCADQPMPSLGRISTYMYDISWIASITRLVSITEISSIKLASITAHIYLILNWTKFPKIGFLVTRPIS